MIKVTKTIDKFKGQTGRAYDAEYIFNYNGEELSDEQKQKFQHLVITRGDMKEEPRMQKLFAKYPEFEIETVYLTEKFYAVELGNTFLVTSDASDYEAEKVTYLGKTSDPEESTKFQNEYREARKGRK